MSEDDWLRSADPGAMLSFIGFAAEERKLRLFASACCRRVTKYVSDDKVRAAIEASERYADGLISRQELESLSQGASSTCPFASMPCLDAARQASQAAVKAASIAAWEPIIYSDPRGEHPDTFERAAAVACEARAAESGSQAEILRDIFGNPFEPAAIRSEWLTHELVETGRRIYEERAFDQISDLASALERAGCRDRTIVAHFHGQSVHVLGCWLLDSILGRGTERAALQPKTVGRPEGDMPAP